MSIKLMDKAWESGYDTGAKFVLLALCDNANDQGVCWPSIPTIARKCGMSERSVYVHLKTLEGAVTKVERPGKPTIYQIDPCRFCTPADSAPLQILREPLQILQTPNKGNPQEPSIGELPVEKKAKAPRTPKTEVARPDDVDEQTWADFLKVRKQHKAPVTLTSLTGLRREAAKAGLTLQQAVTEAVERSWRGFKADWLVEPVRAGFAAPAAVTVPSRPGIDPAIAKVIADAKKAAPPPAHIRERMAQLTRKQTDEA